MIWPTVTPNAWAVLVSLTKQGPGTTSELAERLSMTEAAIENAMDELQAHGFVTQEEDEE